MGRSWQAQQKKLHAFRAGGGSARCGRESLPNSVTDVLNFVADLAAEGM